VVRVLHEKHRSAFSPDRLSSHWFETQLDTVRCPDGQARTAK